MGRIQILSYCHTIFLHAVTQSILSSQSPCVLPCFNKQHTQDTLFELLTYVVYIKHLYNQSSKYLFKYVIPFYM